MQLDLRQSKDSPLQAKQHHNLKVFSQFLFPCLGFVQIVQWTATARTVLRAVSAGTGRGVTHGTAVAPVYMAG